MLKISTTASVLKKWVAFSGSKSNTGRNSLPLIAFLLLILSAGTAVAQTNYGNVPPTFNSRSNNHRAPTTMLNYQRSAAVYPAVDMFGLSTGMQLKSIGFNIDTATSSPVDGTIKIYLANTNDVNYARSTNWNTLLSTPSAMTMVYDGALTIPASTGFYDINFTSVFNYTGGGIYLAFEWTTLNPSSESAWYLTENSLANGVASNASAALMPTTLTPSNFRPFVRFGYTPSQNDASVRAVKGLGKVPLLQATTPVTINATVVNLGANPMSNVQVSLNASGANTHSSTSTIPSLAVGDTTVVSFTSFTPTALGATNITVAIPGDDINDNNSASWTVTVTDSTLSHIPPATQATSSVGYNTGAGLLLNRYEVGNSQLVYVPRIRVQIGNSTNAIGKTVFGVVVDENGGILGRSADRLISGGDLGTMVTFTINDPAVVSLTNQVFFIGLAQIAGTPGYHPVGTASEIMPTEGAYYIAGGAAALNGGVVPVQNNTLGRFMMEADLVTTIISATPAIVSENSMDVYPNPNTGEFYVSFGEAISDNASIAVVDVTGKIVHTQQMAVNGSIASIKTSGLAAGVYVLQVATTSQLITKQLVIK